MKFIYLTFCLSLSLMSPAFAQNKSENTAGYSIDFTTDDKEAPSAQAIAPINKAEMDNIRSREVTVLEDDYAGQYVTPTVQNLSKLYWNKGALALENNMAIDNFLLINECPIYEQYYSDDFEWQRVRKAARMMLEKERGSFADKFKIVIPIDLGRYDMERKGFPLINNTSFMDLRRVEIGGNLANEDICGYNKEIMHYPRNIILVLSKPFNYDFLELDEHIAQAYIIRQKYDPPKRPEHLKGETYNRLAFARIRMKIDKYNGEAEGFGNQPLAVMFGRLEGIDIFEDYEEKRLLKTIDIEE